MLDIHRAVATAVLASAAANAWSAAPEVTNYRGICEASAAVALDAHRFIVADDEHNVLSIYRVGVPKRENTVDLTAYLDTTTKGGKVKKSDIEGAARVKNRIYWIASHSRDKKGHPEESRLRFFATDVIGGGTTTRVAMPKTPPYRDLLKDLIADSRFSVIAAAAAKKVGPEDPAGLNVEGLAATPQGQLLIGFRNPRPGGMALLVPLQNPDEVIAGGASARFGAPILLDLGKRGIRSIDWVRDRYIIVAGPYDNGGSGGEGSDFALYSWSGDASAKPKRWVDSPLTTLAPEAVFEIPDTQSINVLSDDGDVCARQNLAETEMSFRGIVLDLSKARFE
jgi:hypothetical protein